MPAITAPNPNYRTPPSIIAAIIGISAVASIFLAWLVYYHPPVDAAGTHLTFLPALDAILNALCAIFLIIGFRYIRRRRELNLISIRSPSSYPAACREASCRHCIRCPR